MYDVCMMYVCMYVMYVNVCCNDAYVCRVCCMYVVCILFRVTHTGSVLHTRIHAYTVDSVCMQIGVPSMKTRNVQSTYCTPIALLS